MKMDIFFIIGRILVLVNEFGLARELWRWYNAKK